ncbi:MAG: sensor histidine kinase [Acidimicrobiales bacterium]
MTFAGRARLHWVVGAAIVTVTATFASFATFQLTGWPSSVWAVAAVVAASTVPLAVVLAAIDRLAPLAANVLVHTIVAAGMVLLATSTYLLIVLGFEGRPSGGEQAVLGVSIAAAAVIAVFALPARRRLERFANEHVYGQRNPPDAALRTFANRMSRAVPMDELMLQLAETMRATMGLRRAEVWTGSDGVFDLTVSVPDRKASRLTLGADECRVAARTPIAGNAWLDVWIPALLDGRADAIVRAAPVAHLGDLLGLIVAEREPDQRDLDDDQDRALTDIARQLGLALHNVRLDTALQASLDELQQRNVELVESRARIVAAADESRRQIERNLHDGAQQHLVAMAVKLGLARQLLGTDPANASGLVEELRDDVQITLTELRELAHGIYPPLLRTRGLPEALTAAANRATLPVTVDAPDLPRLAPDVEAAVYFCCLEAMQNAGKHAGDRAAVTVKVAVASDGDGDELAFSVVDDGAGFDRAAVEGGHGFVNMADRLGAIGGTLTVTSEPGVGTTISGRLPL